jgi:hypothetical protein
MKTKLTIDKRKFLINGRLTYSEYPNCKEKYKGLLMNARFIQGVFDDKNDRTRFNRFNKIFSPNNNTDELIKALPQWYEKGLRAITVGFQGGGTCNTIDKFTINNNPFSSNGKDIDVDYLDRMDRIIRACDELSMIVIVNLFYGSNVIYFEDDNAIANATKTASNWLRDQGYQNIIIEIANEQNTPDFIITPIIHDPLQCVKLIKIAQRESGGMPVGCTPSGGRNNLNKDIAQASDVILIHGNDQIRQVYYDQIQMSKSIKPERPVLCNEDGQSLLNLGVSFENEVSWGYYNNLTKQEPPTSWEITKGEDFFFAWRLAHELGIPCEPIKEEHQYYIQGLDKNDSWEGKRWIRLSSLYPEEINYVDFYRDGQYFTRAYDSPFFINFCYMWKQFSIDDVKIGEVWKAVITKRNGDKVQVSKIVE